MNKIKKNCIIKEASVTVMMQKGVIPFMDEPNEIIISKLKSMFGSIIIHNITEWEAELTQKNYTKIDTTFEIPTETSAQYLKKDAAH